MYVHAYAYSCMHACTSVPVAVCMCLYPYVPIYIYMYASKCTFVDAECFSVHTHPTAKVVQMFHGHCWVRLDCIQTEAFMNRGKCCCARFVLMPVFFFLDCSFADSLCIYRLREIWNVASSDSNRTAVAETCTYPHPNPKPFSSSSTI